MTYATRADLEERYGVDELAQRETMLPPNAVDKALADADALIDGYMAGRYTVPLSPVPANLPRVACQVARYLVLGAAADERARQDYEDAVSWLKDVAAGRVILTEAAAAATTTVQARPETRTVGRQFDGDSLANY